MKFGTTYNQGEILLVPFPFSDLSEIRKRPVLVLSKNLENKKSEDLIVCGITSNLKERKNSVFIDNLNLVEGEIPIKSVIKVDKLFSLDKSIILKKLAKLNLKTFDRVKKEFYSLV